MPGEEVGFVLADGLSPRALDDHEVGLLKALVAELQGYSLAPPVIATQARVALGDHIAQAMGVSTVLVLIGERPGLSVADSPGIYPTHLPRPGADGRRPQLHLQHPCAGRARLPAGRPGDCRGWSRALVNSGSRG